jgi:hypothetical protein
MKICTKCRISQELKEFRKDKSKKDGIHSACNTCNNKAQRKWYQNNKNKARDQANKSYKKNQIKISARRKELLKDNPEKYKQARRKLYNPIKSKLNSWKYAGIKNMTIERYNSLLISQNGKCAICKIPKEQFKRILNVDHDHQTGEVRGLLCDSCNRGIGYLKDSIDVITSAKNYLLCHKK